MAICRMLSLLFCLFFTSLSSYEVSWDPPVDISATNQLVDVVQVAVNGQGDAVAVWHVFDGVNQTIQSATRAFGSNWSNPVDISVPSSAGVFPQVAINDEGNIVAVWIGFDGSNDVIQASTSNFGGSWSVPVNLSATGQNASNPDVEIDSNGNAITVWGRSNGVDTIVQASTLLFGGSWSVPVDLSTSDGNSGTPTIGIDDNGNAVAAWVRSEGGNAFVQASTLLFGGSWSAPVNVSPLIGFYLNPQIAVDPSGNAVLTWRDILNSIIQAATLPFGGSWSAPVNISASGANSNHVVVDGNGNAVAVWFFFDTEGSIQASFLPFGGSWSPPVDVSVVSLIGSSEPSVAVNESGEIVVVWEGSNGSDLIIQASTAVFGGSWSSPVDLSSQVQLDSLPKVGIDDCGNPVAAWMGSTGVDMFIQASSGTNIAGPQPPAGLIGSWRTNRFVDQKEYINVLKWAASGTSCFDILKYRIYADGVLIGSVSADAPLVFEVRRRKKNRVYVYSVTAVTVEGVESDPISIAIKGGK